MTLEIAYKTIVDNHNGKDNTFIGLLHEKSTFNIDLYWIFYNAIQKIGCENNKDKALVDTLKTQLNKLYGFTLMSVIHHYNESDLYQIDNPPENINQYCENLRNVVEAFFEGRITNQIGPFDFE